MTYSRLNKISFKHLVLGITAVTFAALALLIAFISSFIASGELADKLHQEGVHLTRNLADNSIAPLLYGSPASAENVLDTLVNIQHVSEVSIVTRSNAPLLSRKVDSHIAYRYPLVTLSEPFKVNETEDSLYFSALVTMQNTTTNRANDLLELAEEEVPQEALGYVNLALSKDSTYISRRNIFINNFFVSTGVALMLLFAMYVALRNVTRPLEKLSQLMEQGQRGKYQENTDTSGPKEISGMSLTFNNMIHAIRERERNLSLTLDSIGDAVIATDTAGDITRINPVAEALTGWSASEVVGRPLQEVFKIISAQTRKPVTNPVEKVLHTGKIVGLANHTLLIGKDGSEYQIADSGAPIRDDNGKILGVILVFRDVTQAYQTEEALRRSQKMEAIGRLSGGIAHDFNNQLGVIIGYLDFLKIYTTDNEEPAKWVGTATRATLRCMDLTRQLLTFSRNQTQGKTVVDPNATLKELETMIARSITPEVEVQYFLADDLWLTEINPGEFQDAILNLVINARDAMPDGGKLVIETTNKHLNEDFTDLNPEGEVGDYVQLMLSDTGTGMDKETLEHVFEPFFTTKPEGKGTGLGMAMVYGFMKRYGGYIRVYSELGMGTTMCLYLPRSTASESAATISNREEVELPAGSETILIVDDEVDLLQLTDQYLSDLGYRTRTAENAAQALAILAGDEKFDLLFSDVVMPGGMNGYELAQQATQQWPNLKVLLTSGFTSKTMARNGLARFSAHLIGKPYRKDDLAQRIRRMLDEALEHVNNLAGRTILVVDDEEDVRSLFKLNLENLGCKTLMTDNGDEAIALYRQSLENGEVIDVVILDLSLPGSMDGKEVAEKIRAMEPHAKLIVASGHTEGPEMTRYQDYGFSGALGKHFNREIIKQVLEQVLSSN